ESGLPGFDTATWYGAFAPAKTPGEVVQKLNEDFVRAIRSPEVRSNLEQQGYTVEGTSAEELAQLLRSDLAKWSRVIRGTKWCPAPVRGGLAGMRGRAQTQRLVTRRN